VRKDLMRKIPVRSAPVLDSYMKTTKLGSENISAMNYTMPNDDIGL
jgi:hypothetical protein